MSYKPIMIDDGTQMPVDAIIRSNNHDNDPFAVALPDVNTGMTDLDGSRCQIGVGNLGNELLISPVGQTTFTKRILTTDV